MKNLKNDKMIHLDLALIRKPFWTTDLEERAADAVDE
jgi:hypothetical protein